MKKLLVLCLILCSITVFPEDKEMPPFEIPTARSNGMGGNYAAYTDTVFALLVNPAAIMRVQQKSLFGFSPALLNPKRAYDVGSSMVDIVRDTFQGNYDALAGILDIFGGNDDAPAGFDLREFPLSFAWVSNGLGVGIWNRLFTNPDSAGTGTQINLYGDVIVPIGFAAKLLETGAHSIDVGITVKPFTRIIIQGNLDDSIPLIAGTGFDAGLIYRWDMGLNAGFTANDIFTRGRTVQALRGDKDDDIYYVPFTMNLGAAYNFMLGNFWISAPGFLANTGIALAVNLDDIGIILQPGFNPQDLLMNFRAGFQLYMFDMLFVSGGMRGIWPTAGLGVNLGLVQIDAAYYEKRFANEQAGSIPMLELTVAIRLKAKEVEWPWAQRSILGVITRSANL